MDSKENNYPELTLTEIIVILEDMLQRITELEKEVHELKKKGVDNGN